VILPKGEPSNDYYRLEVSGMGRINTERPESRLARKIAQIGDAGVSRPGLVVVTRFEDMRILSETWP
jgi:hypothetical protein